MPTISVIVPVYNCEKYIKKCAESIINQTFKDLEIIFVDDGSKDESGKICDSLKQQDERIKVIHQENKGVSSARNEGLKIASGDYISFVDGDDYLSRDMYEFLYENLEKNKADVSVCGIVNCFLKADGSEKRVRQSSFNGSGLLSGKEAMSEALKSRIFSVNPVNKLFSAKLFRGEKFPEGKTSEDAFLVPKILLKAKRVFYSSEQKYYYVRHEGSITTSNFAYNDWYVVEAYKNHFEFIKENHPELIKEAEFRYIWAYIYVLDKIIISKEKPKKSDYLKALKFVKRNALKIFLNPYFSAKRKLAIFALLVNKKIYKKLIYKINK
ncbi:MAG: glycosyltransferase [Clostridia bacterium]|nr:glycosyltransferase [Clostridia bacterium]